MKREKIDSKHGNRNIWLFGGSSFFNDVGSEMITPLLPFFISSMGGTGIAIGLVSGLREGLSSLFKLLGGYLSDRTGKRNRFIFLGYFLSIISRALLAFATSWEMIVSLVSLERIGKLRDAPRDAIISVSTKRRGRGFGIHQMMDAGGAVAGTLLVMFLLWKFNYGFQTLIIIAAVVSSLSLVPLFFIKEPKLKKTKKKLFTGISEMSNDLKYFIFVSSIFTLANFGLYLFLILRAKEITGSTLFAFGLYALFSLSYAVFTFPLGSLSDRYGRKRILLFGYLLLFVISFGFIYMTGIFSLVILFILFGLVYAATQSNSRALVSDLSNEMKGTSMGFYHSVLGLVNIPAGLIAGIFWNISYVAMFVYVGIVAAIAVVFLLFVNEGNAYKQW